jgi:subtilase family serine protease
MPFTSKFNRARNQRLRERLRMHLNVELLEIRTLPSIYSPGQIVHAYGIDKISFENGTVKGTGAGQTIAIVDAYYDATVQNDLRTFSTRFALPQLDGASGDGTFTQLDLSNKTPSPSGDDWTLETALDVEWAHAVAPKANILLVEAANDFQNATTGEPTALLNAVHKAATTTGVSVVSMSWGISEVPAETNWDSFFTTPGVTFVAASGDSGAGTIWPAVSPNVVSVGGTTLKLTTSNTIASESGWGYGNNSWYYGGSGGGFSQYENLPSYQSGITTVDNGWKLTGFGVRLNPDVAYVGNPNTGLYVLDGADGGWYQVGGTSAGAPQWSALISIADQGRALGGLSPLSSTQTLNALYANSSEFNDITRGSTGTYYVTNNLGQIVGTIPVKAGVGYDMVTGLGTPIANVLIPSLANVSPANQTHTVTAATASSSGSAKSGSSKAQAIPVGFLFVGGFFQVGQTNATPVLAAASPVLPPSTVPPLPVNPVLAVPVASAPALGLPTIKEESGGGNDSSQDDTANSSDVMPGNTTPTDSVPDQSPQAPRSLPSDPGDNADSMNAASWQTVLDSYFASGGTEFLRQPVQAASDEEVLPETAANPVATAAALGVLLSGYWSAQQSKSEEEARARVVKS